MEWLIAAIADEVGCDDEEIRPDVTLADLGFDSLDIVSLAVNIEEEYGFAIDDASYDTDNTVQWWHDLIRTNSRHRPHARVAAEVETVEEPEQVGALV